MNGHGKRSAADLLGTIPHDTEVDRYGSGGVVTALEQEVAGLLGKEAALFLPTGTMAQQATLRVHADRRGRRGLVWHPACHLDWREGRGYERLHGLVALPAGDLRLPLRRADLESVGEQPAALLLELPQRDLGGTLPEWRELSDMVSWARDAGAAVHLDGARLWEAVPFYGRPIEEIASLFDSVYVSFYKGLGAIAGCCVAGSAEVVTELSQWRTRHGGRIFALWPYAASALTALHARRERMPGYWDHAKEIAAALSALDGIRVLPDPPQSPMMHVQLEVSADELRERAIQIAETEGIWTFAEPYASDHEHLQRLELSVGDATMSFRPSEVCKLIARLSGA